MQLKHCPVCLIDSHLKPVRQKKCFWTVRLNCPVGGGCKRELCHVKNCLLQSTSSLREPASEVTSGLQTKTACSAAVHGATAHLTCTWTTDRHRDSVHMRSSQDVAQHQAPRIRVNTGFRSLDSSGILILRKCFNVLYYEARLGIVITYKRGVAHINKKNPPQNAGRLKSKLIKKLTKPKTNE